MDKKYFFEGGIVGKCEYHVMFCPKYKRLVLTGDIESRFSALCRETCSEIGAVIEEMEIKPDLVYLHLRLPPKTGVHKTVKAIKRRTSRVLCDEFPVLRTKLPTLWTNSYFVSTDEVFPEEEAAAFVAMQPRSQRDPGKGI